LQHKASHGRVATAITKMLVISSGPTERGLSFLQNIARLLVSLSQSRHHRRHDTMMNWVTPDGISCGLRGWRPPCLRTSWNSYRGKSRATRSLAP